jgi:hypothetical protein
MLPWTLLTQSTVVTMATKNGRPARYTDAELALAYELRTERCSWKRIVMGLGGSTNAMRDALYRRTK